MDGDKTLHITLKENKMRNALRHKLMKAKALMGSKVMVKYKNRCKYSLEMVK